MPPLPSLYYCSSVVPTEDLDRDPGGSSSRLGQTSDNIACHRSAALLLCVLRAQRKADALFAGSPVNQRLGKHEDPHETVMVHFFGNRANVAANRNIRSAFLRIERLF
jgi:hypothetical protein